MRKEIFVTITEPGRDFKKKFKITEASAVKTDKWGIRAMLALNRSGANIPDEIMKLGLIGVITVGIHKLRGVMWEDLEPLLDEMMGCVEFVPTPDQEGVTRKLFSAGFGANGEEDIEETSTLATLRVEVLKLHVGFSPPADQSKSPDASAGDGTSSSIQTSAA